MIRQVTSLWSFRLGIETWVLKIEQNLKQFEQWEQEDLERIQRLTEKVQNLHLHSPPTTSHSVSVPGLLPDIQKIVAKSLKGDVLSVIEHLHRACIQNHNVVLHELSRKVQPILDLTAEVHRHAQLEVASSKHFWAHQFWTGLQPTHYFYIKYNLDSIICCYFF